MKKNLWPILETLKEQEWIDLSHELTNESPYWQGNAQRGCRT